MKLIEEGNPTSPLWLVGEAPGDTEVAQGRPFTGASGHELNRLLREAGIARSACYLTNVCHEQPPPYLDKNGRLVKNDIEQWFLSARSARSAADPHYYRGRYLAPPLAQGVQHLSELINRHAPRLIVLLGGTPLWALTGEVGITKWRGSLFDHGPTRLVATFHPADTLPNRNPHHRPILLHDLERAARELRGRSSPPKWDFTVPTSRSEVEEWLAQVPDREAVAADIETRNQQIACLGLASSSTRAMCIPLMRAQEGEHGYSYWSQSDELSIYQLLHSFLSGPKGRSVTFHNGLFDCQYLAKQWGFLPNYTDDTMVMQHVCFPGFLGGKIDPVSGRVDKRGSSLSLSFIASLYCDHYRFWKDDGRLFDPSSDDERQLWTYNCEDCCRTFECRTALKAIIERHHLADQYRFEMSLIAPTLRMMFRGTRTDAAKMRRMRDDLENAKRSLLEWIHKAAGFELNPESTPQMRDFFYRDLNLPPIRNKHTRALTLNDDALATLSRRYPLLTPFIDAIQSYRTMDTIKKDLDPDRVSRDGRLRCALNPAYVETFRYSSNETAFNEGSNLQNIPRRPD